jgi:hypothetical protein
MDMWIDLARLHREELIAEFRTTQLIKEARSGTPGWLDRVLFWSGDLLIKLGQKLREPYARDASPQRPRRLPLPEGICCDH